MIRDQRPNILLIQETKMKKESLGKIKFSSIMSGEASYFEGVSGGLLTLYNNKQFRYNTLYNDGNILLCRMFHMYSNDSWFLLNVYSPNNKREKEKYWSKVCDMVQTSNLEKGIIMGESILYQWTRRRWENRRLIGKVNKISPVL